MTTVNSFIPNTGIENFTSFTDLIKGGNIAGAGYFFTAVDVLVFLVLFITLSVSFGWEAGILSAGFIGIILSILFVYMGVMEFWIAGWFVGALVVMILYIIWSNKYD